MSSGLTLTHAGGRGGSSVTWVGSGAYWSWIAHQHAEVFGSLASSDVGPGAAAGTVVGAGVLAGADGCGVLLLVHPVREITAAAITPTTPVAVRNRSSPVVRWSVAVPVAPVVVVTRL